MLLSKPKPTFIEDIILIVTNYTYCELVHLSSYELSVFNSIADQIHINVGLTEKQSILVERLLKKHSADINKIGFFNLDINLLLEEPKYRLARRILNTEKRVDIVDKNNNKIIEVKFPFDKTSVELIKTYKNSYSNPIHPVNEYYPSIGWNPTTKSWDFDLNEHHIDWIYTTFTNFTFSTEFEQLAGEIKQIKNNIEKYVPMVVFDGEFKFINTHQNIPQPKSNDLLEVLFEAKQYGITVWDESIDIALKSNEVSPATVLLLTHHSQEPIEFPFELENTEDIIKFSNKVLFIIPGGSELSHLTQVYDFLKSKNYSSDQMTVMFRLDSSFGKMCNNYIKETKLNNPLNENIQFVFISAKLPKPLIEQHIQFDTIFNLGKNSAHYSLRQFIKSHHNVINISI
jgi:hypothetical protein